MEADKQPEVFTHTLEAYWTTGGEYQLPKRHYIRGSGPTQAIAKAHAELVRAQERFKIATEQKVISEGVYCLEDPPKEVT